MKHNIVLLLIIIGICYSLPGNAGGSFYCVNGTCAGSLSGACSAQGDPGCIGGSDPWEPSGNSACRALRAVPPYDQCAYVGGSQYSCPGETYFNDLTGTCDACLEGETFNSETGTCDAAAPDCPAGMDPFETTSDGGGSYYKCIPILPPENCDIVGYVGNEPICSDILDQCILAGGEYQNNNGEESCVPIQDPPPPPDLPECLGNTVSTGTSCLPVYDQPEDLPEIGNPNEKPTAGNGTGGGDGTNGGSSSSGGGPAVDTDGDGTPNTEDNDIDGDGTPNDQDTDIDGDGTLNASDNDMDGDGTPNSSDGDMDGDGKSNGSDDDIDGDGQTNDVDNDDDGDGVDDADDSEPAGDSDEDGTEEEESVSGGGNCGSQPSCSGKEPIMCAILVQQWHTRCETEKLANTATGGSSCDVPYSCEQDDQVSCATLKELHELKCAFSELDQDAIDEATDGLTVDAVTDDDVDLQTELAGIYNQTGASTSCPVDQTLNVGGTTVNISYQPFCDLATKVKPITLLLFGLIGFKTVMGAF